MVHNLGVATHNSNRMRRVMTMFAAVLMALTLVFGVTGSARAFPPIYLVGGDGRAYINSADSRQATTYVSVWCDQPTLVDSITVNLRQKQGRNLVVGYATMTDVVCNPYPEYQTYLFNVVSDTYGFKQGFADVSAYGINCEGEVEPVCTDIPTWEQKGIRIR